MMDLVVQAAVCTRSRLRNRYEKGHATGCLRSELGKFRGAARAIWQLGWESRCGIVEKVWKEMGHCVYVKELKSPL